MFDSHPTRRENRGRRTPYPTVHGRWIRRFKTANVRCARHRASLYECNVYAQGAAWVRRKLKRWWWKTNETRGSTIVFPTSRRVDCYPKVSFWKTHVFPALFRTRLAHFFSSRSVAAQRLGRYGSFPPEKLQNRIFSHAQSLENRWRVIVYFSSPTTTATAHRLDKSASTASSKLSGKPAGRRRVFRFDVKRLFRRKTRYGFSRPLNVHTPLDHLRTSFQTCSVVGASRQTFVAPGIHMYVCTLRRADRDFVPLQRRQVLAVLFRFQPTEFAPRTRAR